ncbi:MAG: PIN domain-containing protein [Chloroflexi bacterium]|nr:PIN domain-containing protein [Chloroflexota bacterium]
MTILIDTNVILAYVFQKDVNHQRASQLIHSIASETRIVTAPVLLELFQMTAVRINYSRAIKVFMDTKENFHIEALTSEDMQRMEQIMNQYASAEFDFADTAIMAQAERLNVTRVATFDHRDFEIFRPAHCDYLELLP